MALIVPTDSSAANYTFRVDLDGLTYRIDMRWNYRIKGWMLDLYTSDDVPLAIGRPCVADGLLLQPMRHDLRLPAGDLLVFDSTERQRDPALIDFLERTLLVYLEPSDYP